MAPSHVLILDRDPDRRQTLVESLRAAGHQVVAAAGPEAAAEALGVPGLGLFAVDLALPDLDLATLRRAVCPPLDATPDSLEAAERRHIAATLRHTRGNKRQAALLLGISRSTLLNKIRRYALDVE